LPGGGLRVKHNWTKITVSSSCEESFKPAPFCERGVHTPHPANIDCH
jgi:hypothetical protein